MFKRVLLVATVPSMIGQFNMNNIRILQQMGLQVDVAANFSDYSVWPKERVELFCKELEENQIEWFQVDFSRKAFNVWKHISSLKQLVCLIKERKYSFVHTHTAIASAITRVATKKTNTFVIYTAHGFSFYKGCPAKNKIVFFPVEWLLSNYTDILITINNEDYEIAQRSFKAKKVERIHGVGIPIKDFVGSKDIRNRVRNSLGIKEDEVLLLSVGELDGLKNHIEIIKAMEELERNGFKLIIAGEGDLKSHHQEYINGHGLENSVKLLGYRNDIADLLTAADIFVFPSYIEGLSVALMEAIAAKKLIACSEIRGNVDTVITPCSYFKPDDTSTLITTIQRVNNLSSKEKSWMVETNYNNLRQFSADRVNEEMKEIYQRAYMMINNEEEEK